MKFTKVLASVAAATVAVSTLAVSAFAADALVSMTVTANGGPKDAGEVNLWELPFDETVDTWAGDVDKVVATITSEAYANGALGGNTVAADGWAASAQLENSAAGTNEWVWDGIGGLKSGLDEDGNEIGYFKVEVWWMNAQDDGSAATLTIDQVDFYNKDGDLLATYPVADVNPGETTDPVEPGETEDPAEPGNSDDVNPGDCSGEPVSPDTGVAVAVIPAALAAAAVATTGIVLKKRSK